MIAGGFREDIQDTAWSVTDNNKPESNPQNTIVRSCSGVAEIDSGTSAS